MYHYPNKAAFNDEDNYLVVNGNNVAVQSEYTEDKATRSCDVLNSHEARNGRDAAYKVVLRSEFTGEFFNYQRR